MTPANQIDTFLAERFRALRQDPALALIFPGQGSQTAGMGKEPAAASAAARLVFETADSVLGRELSRLCFEGGEDELTLTANAQPAILVTSIARVAAALEAGTLEKSPAYMAGHSLGEYSALVSAGALTFSAALRLVSERGRIMQEAGEKNPGTMAAVVGLDEAQVQEICEKSGAEPCNYNSPTQIVVGGTPAKVDVACRLAKEMGGRGLPLNVYGAFHTSLMAEAAREFSLVLGGFAAETPTVPVIGNVAATALTDGPGVIEDLRAQIRCPVRWSQSLDFMIDRGVSTFMEAGPGRTLSAILKRSYPEVAAISIERVPSTASAGNV